MSFPWNGLFLEACTILPAWASSDANSDITGDRVKLIDYEGVFFVCYKPAGSAGDDLVLTFQQHDAATSGNSASLSVRNLAWNLGNTAITATQGWVFGHMDTPAATWTTDTTSVTPYLSNDTTNFPAGTAVTDLTADTNAAMLCVDVKASELTSGTYQWFSANSTGSAIGTTLTTSGWYILYGAKYGGRPPLTIEV